MSTVELERPILTPQPVAKPEPLPKRVSPRRQPRSPLPPWRSVLAGICLTLLLVVGWAIFYALIVSSVQEQRTQHELYATFRAELAQPFGSDPAPIGSPIALGAPVAVLDVPAAGIRHVVVVEGTTSGVLRAGPGHLPTSPLPGQPGYSVLYGRAATFGGPFGAISGLHPGDRLKVTTSQGVFSYSVVDIRRAGDKVAPLPNGVTARLTLVTSSGSGWRDGWAPSGVVYVDANLTGSAQPDPGGRPTAIGPDESAMRGEGGPLLLMEVVSLLQLLLIVVVAVAWMWGRWNRWQLWLVGTPTVLVVLWGLTTTASRLLPNLL